MKVALVILHADPSRGGAERYTVDLAAALAARGGEVALLGTSFAHVPEGPKQIPLQARALTRWGQYRKMLDSLDSHLDRTRYDIVHAMLPVRRCDFYHPHSGLASAAVQEDPVSAFFTPRRPAMHRVEDQLLFSPHPPRVLCLSEYVKKSVRKHYPLDDLHLPILFNAVDTKRFHPGQAERPQRDRITALMIAQDFDRKGLREAIGAIKLVTEPRLILRVVGKQATGPYQRLAEREGVASRVEFAGPTTDPVSEYRNADFFVLPTKHDPCSLVVLEALAMGLPVVSTRFNGACEIMTDGRHGFVLNNPQDIPALAAAMQNLTDPSKRIDMSRACLALRPALSYEHHLDELMRIYQQKQYNLPGSKG